MDLAHRTSVACDQLKRYCGSVIDENVADALDALTDVNDDLWHGRARQCVIESVDKVRAALDKIVEGAK